MKKGWEYKKLGEVCKTYAGGTPLKTCKEYYDGGTIPWLRSGEVCRKYIDSTELFITQKGMDNSSAKYYPVNTIVVAMYGATAAQVGILKIESTSNQAVCGILPNDRFVPEFLFYWFTYIKDFLASQAQGGAQPNISQVKIKNLTTPVPPLSEQKDIVEYLDSSFAKIDKLKENAAKNLEEAKALFQSALKDALEPKEGWEEKTLEHIATEMYRGSGIKRDQVTEEGISCVRYGEIYTTYNYYFDICKSHTNEGIITSKKYFENGDILFAITGESVEEIGKSIAYLGKEKCLAGGDIVVMKHNQNPKFLSYSLSTPNAIKQKGYGKTKLKVVHTNIPSLKTIKIPIPSIQEQIKIAEFLDSLNEKVNTLQQNYSRICNECDALKQAILRQVFE